MSNNCQYCGAPLKTPSRGRPRKYCSEKCKLEAFRFNRKRNEMLRGQLVLELFPGAGLFGEAFRSLGAVVVRGPDILWGGDVREFVGVRGKFDGVIGGPPCQIFSKAAVNGTRAQNLIPEFVRIVTECSPRWAVMENVREAKRWVDQSGLMTGWSYVSLRDFDCGGKTHRRRGFWFWGMPAPVKPPRREGDAEQSVLARSWQNSPMNPNMHRKMQYDRAGELQGYPEIAERIFNSQPGDKKPDGTYNGVTRSSRNVLTVHMMGNGVPRAMGEYVAAHVANQISRKCKTAVRIS